jgi:putative oxidoreductase
MMTILSLYRNAITRLERFPVSLLQLVFRISIGAVFFSAGLTKIASWQSTLALFYNEYKVPLIPPNIAAYMATAVELSCPILLFIGLATRLATLPMIGQSLVIAIFVYPEDWVEHLTWISMLTIILVRGPGVMSVDYLLDQTVFRRA